jgi:hypothetical protein
MERLNKTYEMAIKKYKSYPWILQRINNLYKESVERKFYKIGFLMLRKYII